MHAVNSPLFDASGAVSGVVSVAFDVTTRRESERQLSEQEATQRFLADSGAMLASLLEFPEGFEHLARLSVPFLGDLCVIDVSDGPAMRRVAAVHADPSRQDLVRLLEEKYPPEPGSAHPAASVVRGGRPEFSSEMSEAFLRETTRSAEHYEIVARSSSRRTCVCRSRRAAAFSAR